jgi:thiamine-phosphate pyrophosphorylase
MSRPDLTAVLTANFKRSQEAARVIEEFAKLGGPAALSQTAKRIRFALYRFEKRIMERVTDE